MKTVNVEVGLIYELLQTVKRDFDFAVFAARELYHEDKESFEWELINIKCKYHQILIYAMYPIEKPGCEFEQAHKEYAAAIEAVK